MADETNVKVDKTDWMEKGVHGLVESFQTPIKKTEILLKVSEKQIELTDKVASENEKFVRIEEGLHLSEMIEKTNAYKSKLESIQRDMKDLTQRSKQMKLRAHKLQEAKQNHRQGSLSYAKDQGAPGITGWIPMGVRHRP